MTHHRTNMDMYHPGYFGKLGMRHIHLTRQSYWAPTVNIEKLWSFVPEELRSKAAKKSSKTAPIVNVLDHGYSKVLGKGCLPQMPLIVRARHVSKLAEKKILEAGGKVELIA